MPLNGAVTSISAWKATPFSGAPRAGRSRPGSWSWSRADCGSRARPGAGRLPYAEIEEVHVGRLGPERLAGRPALVLDLVAGGPLRIGSINGAGFLHELDQRLGVMRTAGVAA